MTPGARLSNERGNALVLSIIVGFLFLSSIVWFTNWGWDQSRSVQHTIAAQKAFEYADSGVNSTRAWLKSPAATGRLPAGTSTTFTLTEESGRCDVILYRTSPDPSLVSAYSTGYYLLPYGTQKDPVTGKNAQVASIHTIFRMTSVASYLVALPGDLSVSYGVNAHSGIVYAENLTFLPPSGSQPPTEVGEADYLSTVSPSPAPSFVVFYSTPANAKLLTYPPVFATLDPTMRSYYQTLAATAPNPVFSGTVSAPVGSNIYFVNGDADIANAGPLTVNGVWVLYATGNIFIHNNITTTTPNWAAFLSENDIHITADAPDALTLMGNFVCNGTLTADAPGHLRNPGTIAFTGGLVMMSNIDLGSVYTGQKTYNFYISTDPNLKLPNVTDMLERNVSQGFASGK